MLSHPPAPRSLQLAEGENDQIYLQNHEGEFESCTLQRSKLTNVVKPEETACEDVLAIWILAVHPPRREEEESILRCALVTFLRPARLTS